MLWSPICGNHTVILEKSRTRNLCISSLSLSAVDLFFTFLQGLSRVLSYPFAFHSVWGKRWFVSGIELSNHRSFRLEKLLRSLSPTVNLVLPSPSLSHVPRHHIYIPFKYLQGCSFYQGSLIQCLIIPLVNKIFLVSSLNLPWQKVRLFFLSC